jgi:hypothetical protein
MRGRDISQDMFFSYGSLEEHIPQMHSLRPIRVVVDEAAAWARTRLSTPVDSVDF